MQRNEIDQLASAVRLLHASSYHAECGDTRAYDEAAQARKLISDVLARNGVETPLQPDRATLAALDRRRVRLLRAIESGLTGAMA